MYVLTWWSDNGGEGILAVGRDMEKLRQRAHTDQIPPPIHWTTNYAGGISGDDGSQDPTWGYVIEEVEEIA